MQLISDVACTVNIYITSCTGHKLNFSRDFVVEKCNYANLYSDTVAYNLVG